MPRIVVGVDGSAQSRIALDWAMTEAGLRQVPLTVVTVVPVAAGAWGPAGQPSLDPFNEPGREVVQRAAQDKVDKALAERAGQPEVSVTVRAVVGLPADELIQASENAEMLVVAARGAGGFTRLMTGSVSSQVAQHALCPVVVIPAGRVS